MTKAVAADSDGTPTDECGHRRPDRRKIASSWLTPWLRGHAGGGFARMRQAPPPRMIEHDLFDRPGLGPLAFRGIAIAILFAIPLWAALGLVVEWVVSAY